MNKAFIFDFDGVIVDSEPHWGKENDEIFREVYGKEIRKKVGPVNGLSMEEIHKKALLHGVDVPYKVFYETVLKHAPNVYNHAKVTPGIQELIEELKEKQFQLGIVSTSRLSWIELAFKRLHWNVSDFGIVLSIQDRDDLAHKPAPDGYVHAIQTLGASPQSTLILEDSNPGIQAAKAAGATVIGFKQNLIPGYIQEGADQYAEDVEDVIKIVKAFEKATSS